MKSILTTLFAAALSLSATMGASHSDAKTFRWASQGDIATHDPHAQNESFNNQFNGQMYEQLLVRDKNMKPIAGLAIEWKQTSPTVWVLSCARA